MTAPTHIVFGLLVGAGSFSLVSMPFYKDLPAVGCAILGSLLPDVDSPNSSMGRILPFVSIPLERRYGHRTITHSVLALLALGFVSSPLLLGWTSCYAALLLGYLSHLIADCATKSGVPLFYPNPAVCVFPGNAKYRIHTGSMLGEGLVLVGLLILLGLVMPISRMGGMWRSMRYMMATPTAAYADYREANTETVLVFEGRWRNTREAVKGEALILDAKSGTFWIIWKGRVQTCGESGDILPDKTRVRETGKPIRVQTVRFSDQTWGEVLKKIPEGGFVSGRLEASHAFDPVREDRFENAVEFKYANRDQMLGITPILKNLSERTKTLSDKLAGQTEQLEALRRKRPPPHYLDLRVIQSEIATTRREIETLKRTAIKFSGTITIRTGGAH
jgi:inner membrane protein